MNESKIAKLMDTALPVSLSITRPKKHVSIIVRKNELVSVGTNMFRTHPQAKKLGYRFEEVHSELDALKLFNFRFNRFGDMRMSRPCKKCLPWCDVLFDDIWFTTDNGICKL